MRIPNETIDLIRDRCRIEEVVQRYVPTLAKKGKSLLGLCPFHKEKTPSFSVSVDKQLFYCFGCGKGGNVFSFIREMERVGFEESVRIAAAIAGITIVEEKNEAAEEYALMQRINTYAANLYHKQLFLPVGAKALKYVKDRGVSDDAIEKFNIGFAPASWNFVTDMLKKHNAPLALAKKCGLIGEKNGMYYDMFRGRVMFPIADANGRPAAFGGRVTGNEQPKYLNSPESPLFSKRRTLYGFNIAKPAIARVKRAIVVEGYLDVIGCHQAGVENVVAPLGTSLTEEHIRLLARSCTDIVLLFDADSAGINAALKSLSVMKNVSVEVTVAVLPSGDPFEFIIEKGQRAFLSAVDSGKNPIDFQIDRAFAGLPIEGRTKTLVKLFDVIKTVDMESERGSYLKQISFRLELDENAVRKDFAAYTESHIEPKSVQVVVQKTSAQDDYITKCERELVRLLCKEPALIEKASIDFPLSEIKDNLSLSILTKIYEMYYEDENFNPNKLFDFFDGDLELVFLNEIFGQMTETENPNIAYDEIYLNMRRYTIQNKLSELIELVKKNPDNKSGYLTEIDILRGEKDKLSQYIYNPKKGAIYE